MQTLQQFEALSGVLSSVLWNMMGIMGAGALFFYVVTWIYVRAKMGPNIFDSLFKAGWTGEKPQSITITVAGKRHIDIRNTLCVHEDDKKGTKDGG